MRWQGEAQHSIGHLVDMTNIVLCTQVYLWVATAQTQGLTPASPKPDSDPCAACVCCTADALTDKDFLCRCLHDSLDQGLKTEQDSAGIMPSV